MRIDRSTPTTILALTLMVTSASFAQSVPELPQASPKARVEQRVGLTDFALDYSSPGVKDRKVWGEVVPYDELWRSGANAPTTLKASRDFTFGGTAVPAGTYSLFTIPTKRSWTVILNRNLKVQGTSGYSETDDVARVTVKPESIPARERLAFLFAETTDASTRLDLEWDKVRVSVPIQVDTAAQAAENINKTIDEAWRPHFNSARYLLENGGDLDRALAYSDTSIAIKPTWWNHWVKAQILQKKGRGSEAIATAEQAQALGQGDRVYESFFKDTVNKTVQGWKK